MVLFVVMFLSYLAGSFSTARFIARRFGNLDITKSGSKNPGASNVYLLMGFRYALLVTIVDLMKGYLPARIIGQFAYQIQPFWWINERSEIMLAVGISAVIGHIYPIYYNFRGGKGVATISGVLLAVAPISTVIALLVWLAALSWKRTFSLASLTAAITFPIALYFIEGERRLAILGWGMTVPLLLLFTHVENIKRLLKHSELPIEENEEPQDG